MVYLFILLRRRWHFVCTFSKLAKFNKCLVTSAYQTTTITFKSISRNDLHYRICYRPIRHARWVLNIKRRGSMLLVDVDNTGKLAFFKC